MKLFSFSFSIRVLPVDHAETVLSSVGAAEPMSTASVPGTSHSEGRVIYHIINTEQ